MVWIVRAIYMILWFLKDYIAEFFYQFVKFFFNLKYFAVTMFGLVFPIMQAFIMFKISGYIMSYVLDYMQQNMDLGNYPLTVQLTGLGMYLFETLGIDQAINMVITASLMRFLLSASFFKRG